jgi:hypothetical protein
MLKLLLVVNIFYLVRGTHNVLEISAETVLLHRTIGTNINPIIPMQQIADVMK